MLDEGVEMVEGEVGEGVWVSGGWGVDGGYLS